MRDLIGCRRSECACPSACLHCQVLFYRRFDLTRGDPLATIEDSIVTWPQCGEHSIGNELHMVFECPALHPLRQQHLSLCTSALTRCNPFFRQQNHMQAFSFILNCLDFLKG